MKQNSTLLKNVLFVMYNRTTPGSWTRQYKQIIVHKESPHFTSKEIQLGRFGFVGHPNIDRLQPKLILE